MFGYFKDFAQKHKKKIVIAGVLAAGTFAVTKFVQWKYDEWENSKVAEYALLAKKQYHFESNQKTCTMTFFSFLPDVRNTIADNLNTESLLDVLKLKPANKLEIWEQLKVISVSRVVCSVVSNVLLLVVLKIQLNVVGGYMFVQSQESDVPVTSCTEMNEVQVSYMNNIRYFLEKQLVTLLNDCVQLVQSQLKDVSLGKKLSHKDLKQLVTDILKSLQTDNSTEGEVGASDRHSFCKYIVNRQWIDENDSEPAKDEIYLKMTSETIDLLESKDCSMVLDRCLTEGMDYVLETLKESFLGNEDPEAIVSLEDCVQSSFYQQINLPMAKVIPILNSQLNEIFNADCNGLFDVLFSQRHLREFTNNIYEAFSSKY